jgi:hypothetical protein
MLFTHGLEHRRHTVLVLESLKDGARGHFVRDVSLVFFHRVEVFAAPEAEAYDPVPLLAPEYWGRLGWLFDGVTRLVPHSPHFVVSMLRAGEELDGARAVVSLLHRNTMVETHAEGWLSIENTSGAALALPIVAGKVAVMTVHHEPPLVLCWLNEPISE